MHMMLSLYPGEQYSCAVWIIGFVLLSIIGAFGLAAIAILWFSIRNPTVNAMNGPNEEEIRKFEQENGFSGNSRKYGKHEVECVLEYRLFGMEKFAFGKSTFNHFRFKMKPIHSPKGFTLVIARYDLLDAPLAAAGRKRESFSTEGVQVPDGELAKNYKITTNDTFKANRLLESGAFKLIRKRTRRIEFESIRLSENSLEIDRPIFLLKPLKKDEIDDYAKFCEKICEKLERM